MSLAIPKKDIITVFLIAPVKSSEAMQARAFAEKIGLKIPSSPEVNKNNIVTKNNPLCFAYIGKIFLRLWVFVLIFFKLILFEFSICAEFSICVPKIIITNLEFYCNNSLEFDLFNKYIYNNVMGLFFKKNKEKESNVAHSPAPERKPEIMAKSTVFYIIWNILSFTLYSCYMFFVIYHLSSKNFLAKAIPYLLGAYALSFVILIILSLGSRKKLKRHLKNYQSAVKFFKYAIQIINFVLSIVTAISALITTGTTDISAVLYAVLSFIITLVFIVIEVIKIIIRKNLPIIKYNFLEIRDRDGDYEIKDGELKKRKKE